MHEAALRAAQGYDEYMVPVMFAPWARVLLDRAGLRTGERVLDIACGSGAVARPAAARVGPAGQVAALDLNPAMLEVARSHSPEAGAAITWHQGSAQALPFGDETFDLAVCQQGLQFFSDPLLALTEMRRVLAPGGRVALLVSGAITDNPLYQRLNDVAERLIGAPVYAAPFALGDAEQLRHLLSSAGFGQVEVRAESREVHFPFPGRFVGALTQGASAAIPALAAMSDAERATLAARIQAGAADWLDAHTQGGQLVDHMAVNIALGRR